MHARLGMPVDASDGPWGELDDFVVDPTNWHITHLVVQPHHHHERSHLVSVDEVGSCDDRLELALTGSAIDETPKVEVTEFIRVKPPAVLGNGWTSDAGAIHAWPYYPLGGTAVGFAGSGFITGYSSTGSTGSPQYAATTFDHLPHGRVEIRRSSQVVTSDDHTVGKVDGFLFDDDGLITHLVLDHGHLWGRREVTIPIEHVFRATREQVHLDVTRAEVGEFPAVKFHRQAGVTV